jgi:hypothetical protein
MTGPIPDVVISLQPEMFVQIREVVAFIAPPERTITDIVTLLQPGISGQNKFLLLLQTETFRLLQTSLPHQFYHCLYAKLKCKEQGHEILEDILENVCFAKLFAKIFFLQENSRKYLLFKKF